MIAKRLLRLSVILSLFFALPNVLDAKPKIPIAKPIPKAPPEPQRSEKKVVAKKPQQERFISHLDVGYSVLSPVTYDRLGVHRGTGIAKRDPERQSYTTGVSVAQMYSFGGPLFRIYGRGFQGTNNNETGRYTDQDIGFRRETKVRSSGYGIGLGWMFRSRLHDIIWLPSLSLLGEWNTVEISGFSENDSGTRDDINLSSELSGVVLELGQNYRLYQSSIMELELVWNMSTPLKTQSSSVPANIAESDISVRLHHGMRFGLSLGLAFGVWL